MPIHSSHYFLVSPVRLCPPDLKSPIPSGGSGLHSSRPSWLHLLTLVRRSHHRKPHPLQARRLHGSTPPPPDLHTSSPHQPPHPLRHTTCKHAGFPTNRRIHSGHTTSRHGPCHLQSGRIHTPKEEQILSEF